MFPAGSTIGYPAVTQGGLIGWALNRAQMRFPTGG